jgi:hypothetical protein
MKGLAWLAAFALVACVHAQRVSPHYQVDHAFSVALDRTWTDVSRSASPLLSAHVHLFTIHGPALESLYLVGGLKSGDPLWAPARGDEHPIYHADFSRSEIVEFVTTSVTALGYVEVTPRNIRPAALAGQNGLRFDIEMHTMDGLDVSGTALAAQSGDRLNLILFLAPREHFYPTLMPEIDRMLIAAAAG